MRKRFGIASSFVAKAILGIAIAASRELGFGMNGTPAAQMHIKDTSVPVVVLSSSQHGGLGIIRSLGREEIPVYSVHQSKWEPAARSRFLQRVFVWDFSSAAADDSVKILLELAQTIGKRSILIPTSDVTAGFVAGNAGRLGNQYLLATASPEVLHQFSRRSEHTIFVGN